MTLAAVLTAFFGVFAIPDQDVSFALKVTFDEILAGSYAVFSLVYLAVLRRYHRIPPVGSIDMYRTDIVQPAPSQSDSLSNNEWMIIDLLKQIRDNYASTDELRWASRLLGDEFYVAIENLKERDYVLTTAGFIHLTPKGKMLKKA